MLPGWRSANYSRRHFDDVMKEAKLEAFTSRDLRATFATHLGTAALDLRPGELVVDLVERIIAVPPAIVAGGPTEAPVADSAGERTPRADSISDAETVSSARVSP